MEDCLAALRQEVDRLDDQIAELFLQAHGGDRPDRGLQGGAGAALDGPRRELEVLRSAAAETLDEGRKLELAHLFETVLALSRRDLRRRVGGNDRGPGYSRCRRAEAPRGSRWRDPGWSIRAWRGHTARWPPCAFWRGLPVPGPAHL